MAHVFTVGELVRLVGLTTKQSLNGAVGTVIGKADFVSRGKYTVHLQNPAAAVAAYPSDISLNSVNLIKMVGCSRLNCDQIGFNACSACLREFYCCAECQKKDWKAHKIVCDLVKLMSNTALQPCKDIYSALADVLDPPEAEIVGKVGMEKYIRLLKHTEAFAEHQFGKRIPGKRFYERDNGEYLGDNWTVEIGILLIIYHRLGCCISKADDAYRLNSYFEGSCNIKDCWTNRTLLDRKALAVLEVWKVQTDLSKEERTDILDEEKIERLLYLLSAIEKNLSDSHFALHNYDEAQYHCKQSVFYGKKMKEGEERRKRAFDALSLLGDIHRERKQRLEEKAVREEAYMFVSEVYNPEHSLVLEAGEKLIGTLNITGDYYDAERFARVCYESLTRPPLDPESYQAAKAGVNLAEASYNLIKGNSLDHFNTEEIEKLAAASIRILKKLYGKFYKEILIGFTVLISIRFKKCDFGEETRSLLDDFLSDAIREQGVNSELARIGHEFLGSFHLRYIKKEMIPKIQKEYVSD